MLCDLGSVGDTTKADFFLGELFDFPGGGFSLRCVAIFILDMLGRSTNMFQIS